MSGLPFPRKPDCGKQCKTSREHANLTVSGDACERRPCSLAYHAGTAGALLTTHLCCFLYILPRGFLCSSDPDPIFPHPGKFAFFANNANALWLTCGGIEGDGH